MAVMRGSERIDDGCCDFTSDNAHHLIQMTVTLLLEFSKFWVCGRPSQHSGAMLLLQRRRAAATAAAATAGEEERGRARGRASSFPTKALLCRRDTLLGKAWATECTSHSPHRLRLTENDWQRICQFGLAHRPALALDVLGTGATRTVRPACARVQSGLPILDRSLCRTETHNVHGGYR
eukprot:6135876-Pleurochrysis_carterae.AAC.3